MNGARLLFALSLLGGMNAFAGRPVFQQATLEELVQRADFVAVVEKQRPFRPKVRKIEGDCAEESWPLAVTERLKAEDGKTLKGRPLKGLKRVEVAYNETALTDCLYRLKNPSGASFAAERYVPSEDDVFEKKRFIVFAALENDRLKLVVGGSIESEAKRKEVLALLAPAAK